ncbi:Uncharacterised protein [Delftia tsuruhatensis]|uniref:hypothetical protein n=1 Tax=Delftia tsuruhatensis TaxID=180282 RepID=UPI001E810E84|nr:hypothetical protein [Delftia tsuruhatensis]CAB5694749.1 Uncharacterised protein [Delftia tsuruhatensis]CAC9687103.1 Uncharacterised protein [Delftia tsuruhatensis]
MKVERKPDAMPGLEACRDSCHGSWQPVPLPDPHAEGQPPGPDIRRAGLAGSVAGAMVLLGCLVAMPSAAQVAGGTTVFTVPGVTTYVVPPGTVALQVEVRGGGGGAGGWDDARGGDGAGGAIVTAMIAVQGGESVHLVVGAGGIGTVLNPFGQGAAGGGAGQPGAGGAGGDAGSVGSSPGGSGGGGASSLRVNGAMVLAGGGGGGGSNSRIFQNGQWNVPADSAVNALALGIQDAACLQMVDGGSGESAGTGVDGSGGGGGGGGYQGQAGQGGISGRDGSRNSGPGTSGGSCTLEAGPHRISAVGISEGSKAQADRYNKAVQQEAGEDGRISITAIAGIVPGPGQARAIPVFDGAGWLLATSVLGSLGALLARRRKRQVP